MFSEHEFINMFSEHEHDASWQELFEQLQTGPPGDGDGEPVAERNNFTTETTSTSTETGSYKKQNGLDYPVNVARWEHSSSPDVCGWQKIQNYSLRQECSKTDCFYTFRVPIGYWTLPKVLEKDNSASLTNQIIFQPKSHLNIFGHDSTKWAPATKNQVNRLNQTFWRAPCWTNLVFFSPRVFVNNIFEIEANHSLPETKDELVK